MVGCSLLYVEIKGALRGCTVPPREDGEDELAANILLDVLWLILELAEL